MLRQSRRKQARVADGGARPGRQNTVAHTQATHTAKALAKHWQKHSRLARLGWDACDPWMRCLPSHVSRALGTCPSLEAMHPDAAARPPPALRAKSSTASFSRSRSAVFSPYPSCAADGKRLVETELGACISSSTGRGWHWVCLQWASILGESLSENDKTRRSRPLQIA